MIDSFHESFSLVFKFIIAMLDYFFYSIHIYECKTDKLHI